MEKNAPQNTPFWSKPPVALARYSLCQHRNLVSYIQVIIFVKPFVILAKFFCLPLQAHGLWRDKRNEDESEGTDEGLASPFSPQGEQ